MSEYGFDYLTDRIDLLEEARTGIRTGGRRGRAGYNPEENFAVLDPKFNKIYEFIGDTIKQGGKSELSGEEVEVVGKGDKRHRYRQLQWPLLILMEMGDEGFLDYDSIDDVDDLESGGKKMNNSIKKFCKHILGIDPSASLARLGIGDNLTLMSKALRRILKGEGEGSTPEEVAENAEVIRPYHEIINSQEFKDKATDVNEILNFSEHSRVGSAQALASATERERTFNLPHKEIDRVQVAAIPLVSAINRMQTAEKKRHNPKYVAKLATQGRDNATSDSFVDDSFMLLDALDNLEDIKRDMQGDLRGVEVTDRNKDAIFGEYADSAPITGQDSDNYRLTADDLEALYTTDTDELFREIREFLEDSKTSGGVELDDYQADMGKMSRDNPQFSGVLRAFVKEIDGIRDANEEIRRILPDSPESSEPRYRGFNDQILDMVLKTDEDRDVFDKWYNIQRTQRLNALKKLGERISLITGKDSGFDTPMTKAEMPEFRRAISAFDKKRGNTPEPSRPSGATPPKVVPTKKAPVRPTKAKPKEEDEEDIYGVMNYMTEQIVRDKRTNPKGEFKDRGFKKARSYTEWLWLNEQRNS